jgi:hypothetical protein
VEDICITRDEFMSVFRPGAAGDQSDVADAPEEAVTGGSSALAEHADHPDTDTPNVTEDGDDNETYLRKLLFHRAFPLLQPSSQTTTHFSTRPNRARRPSPKRSLSQHWSWHPPMTTTQPILCPLQARNRRLDLKLVRHSVFVSCIPLRTRDAFTRNA